VIHRSFFIGPGLSLSFLALCFAKNVGPGAFFLSLALVAALAIGQPLIQFGLMHWLERPVRPWVAWAISFFAALALVTIAVVTGAFNFW
jgi:hypothetical protein